MAQYNPKSLHAEEFINHEEILETLKYAEENKRNIELIDSILEKARPQKTVTGVHCAGLTHREASVLLACDIPEKIEEMYQLAEEIKLAFYGNRIVMFAPLYLSNYCVNGCVYCPYHAKNRHITRKKLTQEEVAREVIALQDMGHKRLAIEAGEDPVNNPIEYILECINTIYSIKHKNGAIRRVNVNIAATTVENYRKLKDAGIGTYILFQETYHKQSYLKLHPAGPKHDYDYHTEAMDRAMDGGIDDVGLGVLFGLEMYKYEFAGLLMHAEHLEAVHGVGPHTISVPRIKRADDIDPDVFDNGLSDELFAKVIACIRIAVPYTGMIISTRESQQVRERALGLGISQISGASRTSVGGYEEEERPHDSEQFAAECRYNAEGQNQSRRPEIHTAPAAEYPQCRSHPVQDSSPQSVQSRTATAARHIHAALFRRSALTSLPARETACPVTAVPRLRVFLPVYRLHAAAR